MNGQGILADPWADVINEQEQERERSRYEQMRGAQEAEYAEMGEIVQRNTMENAKRQMSFNNLLASAVKFSNGGALPEVVRNYMNRKMGFDGVRTGVLGGGYQQDGSYAFEFANGADGQGNVARQTQSFSPSSLYNMMNINRVAFDDNDRATMRQNLLSSGLSEKEVETMDAAGRVYGRVADPQHISNMMTAGGGAGGRQIGGTAVMKRVDRRPHAVRAYSNVQTPGRTAGGRVFGAEADGTPFAYELGEEKPEAANWHQFSVGPSDDGKTQVRGYKNEVSGEVVYVKDGETPPWRQGAKQRGMSLDDRIALEREKTAGRKEIEGMKGETRLKVADIQKALKERGLDISEDKVAELIRHNKATESAAGAKQTGGGFNKTIYERYVSELNRLEAKGSARTKDEEKELKRIQNKIRVMEGDDPEAEEHDPTDDILLGGNTGGNTGGTLAPGVKNPPAAKQPAPAKAAAGVNAGAAEVKHYGLRHDGKTYKGSGWLGELKTANGGVATEYSIGVNIDGREVDIPSLVPTLTKDEVSQMVNDIIPNNKPVPGAIVKKAADFAKMRIGNGMSVWANDGRAPNKKEIDAALAKKRAAKEAAAKKKEIAGESRSDAVKPTEEAEKNPKWDDAKEAEFQEYFKDLQKARIWHGIPEKDARELFENDVWIKFKRRVKKNLDDMDSRRETKSTGRRATGVL